MIKKDVIIIGASASGMMSAISSGKRGRSVLVLDYATSTAFFCPFSSLAI